VGLHDLLTRRLPGGDFRYLLSQRGMFSYTGLSPAQVDRLREQYAIYLLRSGRMCIAGLNAANLDRVAAAIARVMEEGAA
jgi:aromatic-amino-acid transaminase